MRRLLPFAAICLLSGCATFGESDGEAARKYVVFFNKGSAQPDRPASMVISEAAAVAMRHPGLSVTVAGFAAANGNRDVEQRLSASRANAVAMVLQGDGVQASRITEHGRPPSNEDPQVGARRVEIAFESSLQP